MIKLEDAYFGIMLLNFNNGGTLESANLFNSMRVRYAIARWKTQPSLRKIVDDPLFFCFGSTWGRCEYEWIVSPWVGDGEPDKVCVYDMYVKPNEKLLMSIVDDISVASCRRWIRSHKR